MIESGMTVWRVLLRLRGITRIDSNVLAVFLGHSGHGENRLSLASVKLGSFVPWRMLCNPSQPAYRHDVVSRLSQYTSLWQGCIFRSLPRGY